MTVGTKQISSEEFWKFVEETSKEVAEWPDWKFSDSTALETAKHHRKECPDCGGNCHKDNPKCSKCAEKDSVYDAGKAAGRFERGLELIDSINAFKSKLQNNIDANNQRDYKTMIETLELVIRTINAKK